MPTLGAKDAPKMGHPELAIRSGATCLLTVFQIGLQHLTAEMIITKGVLYE
jgi:hypothetical protein